MILGKHNCFRGGRGGGCILIKHLFENWNLILLTVLWLSRRKLDYENVWENVAMSKSQILHESTVDQSSGSLLATRMNRDFFRDSCSLMDIML